MGKKSKMKKVKNPWESEDGSGTRGSSAEEQFEELDKEMIMEHLTGGLWEPHTSTSWRKWTRRWREMLMKFRENITGIPEDQRNMAVWSLMCMVERRKEEQREERGKEEVEKRERESEQERRRWVRREKRRLWRD